MWRNRTYAINTGAVPGDTICESCGQRAGNHTNRLQDRSNGMGMQFPNCPTARFNQSVTYSQATDRSSRVIVAEPSLVGQRVDRGNGLGED
jgi:hypothetical protein